MLTIEALILMLIIATPNHELNRDPALRSEVAGHFYGAGSLYNFPASLLTRWAWDESRFKMSAVGTDRPSIGYGQIHGRARKICEVVGHDPTTLRGNIYCMSLIMALGKKFCGSIEGAVKWYSRGSCRVSKRTDRKIKRRLRAWMKNAKR